MFIFLLFDVFDSAYKNGFADGFSAVVLIRAAIAVYAWKRKCGRFRADFVTFLRKAGENAAGPYEVDRFENQISDCWCLPEAIRRRIIALLPPIRDYATQSFRSRFPAWQNSVSELETMARRLLVRILRYRQSFWQRAYNKRLFDDLDRIEQFEAPPQMTDFFGNGEKTHPVPDWNTTCVRRAEMVAILCSEIEKINPFF